MVLGGVAVGNNIFGMGTRAYQRTWKDGKDRKEPGCASGYLH
jgi:hypothetical protein